ncbi:Na+/H+ antiporter subunit E [Helicovermis profundi]|uniref:Na+/H+ antiporter subunit E n=1 Tax=Helicovermis profundi TaxID=3065157 RepID=A0AAU9EAL9_9FIRM|nr:Na+/H+ antiporter subunit E [Clostridia bacterium S502]
MTSKIIKILSLTVFFVILSEKISLLNIISAVTIAYIVFKINTTNTNIKKYFSFHLILKWIFFTGVLFKEVVVANFQVAKIALSPSMDIKPIILDYHSKIKDEFLLTILSNAITLTPGTMTVDIHDNLLKIHCLNETYANSLKDIYMEKILFDIEGELNV